MRAHRVRQGECLASIAPRFGWDYRALFEDASNAKLRERRENPNVLMPGDIVMIPEPRARHVECATTQRHRFRRTLIRTTTLRLYMRERDGTAIANTRYILRIARHDDLEGTTSGDGLLEKEVGLDVHDAEVLLFVDGAEDEHAALRVPVRVGHLDPIDQVTGVQARLRNLGHACDVSGTLCDATRAALTAFQRLAGLEPTGELDDTTRLRLQGAHRRT